MARVSYQSILEDGDGTPPRRPRTRYVALRAGALATRRKDATRGLRVRVSPDQKAWLREIAEVSGKGIDEDAVVRALIDVGRELPVDWPLLSGGEQLRQAVRETVRVRAGAPAAAEAAPS